MAARLEALAATALATGALLVGVVTVGCDAVGAVIVGTGVGSGSLPLPFKKKYAVPPTATMTANQSSVFDFCSAAG